MRELEIYYSALFFRAEKKDKYRKRILLAVLALLIASFYFSQKTLFILSATAFILQIISMFINASSKSDRSLANRFQKIFMLTKAFGIDLADKNEISTLKINAGNKMDKEVTEKLKSKNNESNITNPIHHDKVMALLLMVQENSFWNDNLYKLSYRKSKAVIILSVLLIITAAIFMMIILKPDPNYTLLRLTFAILSFGIVGEFVDTMLKYKNSSERMKELDNRISGIRTPNIEMALDIFSSYHLIKSITPSIPKRIYSQHNQMLNNAWESRKKINT